MIEEDFSNNSSENFEKIRERADSYGYNINYGRVIDHRNVRNDATKIIISGVVLIGGFIYLKRKLKKLFNEIKGDNKTVTVYNVNESHETKKSESKIIKNSKIRLYDKNNKDNVIDVEYKILDNNQSILYDSKHPDDIEKRSFSCQYENR